MKLNNKPIFYKSKLFALIFCLFLTMISNLILATDEEAKIELEKAKTAYLKKDYRNAGDYYLAAKLYADSRTIKKEALEKAADAYGKANQKYKQFNCLRNLIAGFSDQIDFEAIVKKEYEIGNDFAHGHRDITLSWMPWIKGKNKSIEIYESILGQAPFAKFASVLKLRLGRMYLEKDKIQKSLNIFRQIIKQHPKSPEDKYARFELANALVQMAAKAGDGNGVYAREADEVLRATLKKYPDDPETQWIKQSILDTDEVRAKRLFDIAKFYVSRKNPEAATRYFHELLARYPKSSYVAATEKQLTKLDENYTPPEGSKKAAKLAYPMTQLPNEPKVILIAPQASGGKWLLPIEDLDLDGKHAEAEYQAKLIAKKEAKEKAKREREKRVAAARAKRKKEEAVRKVKRKAALIKKEKEDKIATEKAAIEKAKVEKLEKEIKAKAKAEKKERKRKAKQAAKNPKGKKKETPKNKQGKGQSKKTSNKKNKNKLQANEELKINAKIKKADDSSGSIYTIPLILLILALIAGITYYLKKKKNAKGAV